jgi:hypothetical protein
MSTEPPVSEDDRRLIVRVREYLAWLDTQPMSDWTVRTLEAIRDDRESDDYANDETAIPPSLSALPPAVHDDVQG